MKTTVPAGLLLTVIVLALAAIGISRHNVSAQSEPLQLQIVGNPALNRQVHMRYAARDAINRLNAVAPPFDRAYFGPGTRTISWRAQWSVNDLFETSDGTQYVIALLSKGFAGDTLNVLGRLANGNLVPIAVPEAGRRGTTIQFTSASFANVPVIEVQAAAHGISYYSIVGDRPLVVAGAVGTAGSHSYGHLQACQDLRQSSSPFAFVSPIVTKAELRMATSLLSDSPEIQIGCFHFAHLDLVELTSNDLGVTYGVFGGKMRLVTRGSTRFASPRFLLYQITESSPNGSTDYQDYLEVFAH